MSMNSTKKVSIFLDSGAFSAYSAGAVISINEYIKFIHSNAQYLDVYANLDVIGDPDATRKNQLIMEEAGLSPIPCYHYGEDPKYLEWYLKRGYDMVAFGGVTAVDTSSLRVWLDMVFSTYICSGKDRLPIVKVHGFGMTSLDLLIRYPWYSVDSTSWLVSRFGVVLVPRYEIGCGYMYSKRPWKVYVSAKSPAKKDAGKHITTFSKMERELILRYFTEKGFCLGESKFDSNGKEVIIKRGLCNDYKQRDALNIMYFLDLERHLPEWPWPFTLNVKRGFDL